MHSSLRALRLLTTGVVAAGVAASLSSCSALGLTASPAAAPSDSSTAVVDPSVAQSSAAPSASDSAAPSVAPSAGDSPTPTPVPTASAAAAPAKAVTPFITLASASGGDLSVSAIVPKVVEQGGTCTLTAVHGDVRRQAVSAAAPASSYTGCNPLAVPASALSAGTWTVQVSYRSATSAGTSSTRTVEVG